MRYSLRGNKCSGNGDFIIVDCFEFFTTFTSARAEVTVYMLHLYGISSNLETIQTSHAVTMPETHFPLSSVLGIYNSRVIAFLGPNRKTTKNNSSDIICWLCPVIVSYILSRYRVRIIRPEMCWKNLTT